MIILITFFFYDRPQDDILKNTTRSELSFVPTTDDDGKSITCRSENPNVNGLYMETLWKLNVVCKYKIAYRLNFINLYNVQNK